MKKKAITIAIAAIVVASVVLGVAGCGTNKGSAYIVTPMPDGTYRFDAWRRTEYYTGKKKVLFEITAECRQSIVTVFDYEPADYTITDAEKLNLA